MVGRGAGRGSVVEAIKIGESGQIRKQLPLDLPSPSYSHPLPPSPPPTQVCIEDPFEVSHDLGRTVDRQTRAVLHKEFTRAATLLRDAEDPLDQLFQPYRAGSRNNS